MKKSPLATILLVVFVDLIGFGMIIPILPSVLLSVIPILVVYSRAQKYFTQGVVMSGIKG